MVDKPKNTISKREALNAKGEDVSDYTEAVVAKYTYLETGKSIEWNVAHIENPVDRALAIEGFLNKAGHAINKAVNSKTGDGDPDATLQAFYDNLVEGGWTNRQGGNEINLGAVLEAFDEFKQWPAGTAKDKWATYNEEQKTRVRTNPHIKAIIQEKRTAKAKAAAAGAKDADLADL